MTPSEPGSNAGEKLPDTLVDELDRSDDRKLREVIQYAQGLLHSRHDPTAALEARDGEEILQIHEQEGYTIVIVKRTDVTGADQGPFVYRVKYERGLESDGGEFRWRYLGRVVD